MSEHPSERKMSGLEAWLIMGFTLIIGRRFLSLSALVAKALWP